MENLEHKRARKAHEFVIAVDSLDDARVEQFIGPKEFDRVRNHPEKIEEKKNKIKKDYQSLVQSAGPLIHQAGLFQTLAFYFQKGKPHHQLLRAHLLGWLFGDYAIDAQTLYFNKLLVMNDMDARCMTAKAQAFLLWLKRFAAAKLPKAETDEE